VCIYIKRWQRVLQEKRLLSNKARRRALLELRNALDLAGQVYTFGTGAYGQFGGEVSKDIGTKSTPFVGFEDIAKLWHGRVTPADSFLATIGADDPGAKKLADLKVKQTNIYIQRILVMLFALAIMAVVCVFQLTSISL
jgi:hypothetical protein